MISLPKSWEEPSCDMIFPKHRIEQFTVEEIDTHVRKVGGRIGGLFQKRSDTIFIVCGENAKTRGFSYGNVDRAHGHVRLLVQMEGDHRLIIHRVNMIAGEDQHQVRKISFDKAKILLHGIGRPANQSESLRAL